MDPERKFKNIEVVDSKTGEVCKIACMSCIRGHRTTTCGGQACRRKILWTVKRPGRPSNSCNCPHGATGGCKCVVARSACPHKPKKGEKRTVDCRCDEQGRYCCFLQDHDWEVLASQRKPVIEFLQTREMLETKIAASQASSTAFLSTPGTPALSNGSPHTLNSTPATPAALPDPLAYRTVSAPYPGHQPPTGRRKVPRFGMMGIGAPQGNTGVVTADVLAWTGTVPEVSQLYGTSTGALLSSQPDSQGCCMGLSVPPSNPSYFTDETQDIEHRSPFGTMAAASTFITSPTRAVHGSFGFDFDKLTRDYFSYQLPSAICQTCGMNGCTCRNCPPVMQNGTGAWAHCCSKKHARTEAYMPPTAEPLFIDTSALDLKHRAQTLLIAETNSTNLANHEQLASMPPPYVQPQQLHHQRPPDHAFYGDEPSSPDYSLHMGGSFVTTNSNTESIDLSELLASEIDRQRVTAQRHGGCCGGEG